MSRLPVVAAVVSASVLAFADAPEVQEPSGCTSDGTLVYLRPETSSFWHTATNSTMTLPVEFPAGASSATLAISSAFGYSRTIPGIVASSVTVTLPEPKQPLKGVPTEDVYDFTLTFDDGTVRTARLGLVAGLASEGAGETRCLAPATGRAWPKTYSRAVIPIPYGMTSFMLNGEPVDAGLGGAQGWFALQVETPGEATLSGTVGDDSLSAVLKGAMYGAFLFLR